jgi:adenylyltransferase/sulfurtransferase
MFAGSLSSDASVEEVRRRLAQGESLDLVDVREAEEYQLCRLPGSRWIPLRELAGRLDELDREREIIVYCHHGIRSARAVSFLRQMGFTGARNLRGGIDEWARKIDPTMPTY